MITRDIVVHAYSLRLNFLLFIHSFVYINNGVKVFTNHYKMIISG
ncbi:hypothetical protein tinsulaeT_04790 [Thalassotalea insulae]|uniref:Uncharacterized protein n=1 Tax=Thalassotalea insulae TaxID=2056778 RepID=A0ABQ6GPP9_9GAMM|nr:hypothetical protein tinsulaeT_04790 [Thalassotalea insulae]